MFTFKEIHSAYLRCKRGKGKTHNAIKFEMNLVENICNLEEKLNKRTYMPARCVCFLTTSPKLREVFAADFSDRVVHHLVTPVLEKIYEPKFIHDSYSCRVGKGIHNAQKRALKFSKATNYYLQLDIRNFFYSIDKNILFNMLNSTIVQNYHKVDKSAIELNEMLWLVHKIIFYDITKNVYIKGSKEGFELIPSHKTLFKVPKNKGLPIGNLTSQFFANVYMNDFDNFCKRVLKCKRYIRYVDDFVIFDNSKDRLVEIKSEIELYLEQYLKLKLRDKTILRSVHDGLDFLGYIIRPHYVLVRRRVIKNYKHKKARYLDSYEKQKGEMSLVEIKQFLSVQASFVGHISHANSYNLCKKVGVINENNPFDDDRA
ncbi:MAG: group II intron reverse transcriptase domain-containing protein [Sulfurimonas sp.]|nr:group II intron reverse transcriptase domain-containing protein [Sulfurimonas sp.]